MHYNVALILQYFNVFNTDWFTNCSCTAHSRAEAQAICYKARSLCA